MNNAQPEHGYLEAHMHACTHPRTSHHRHFVSAWLQSCACAHACTWRPATGQRRTHARRRAQGQGAQATPPPAARSHLTVPETPCTTSGPGAADDDAYGDAGQVLNEPMRRIALGAAGGGGPQQQQQGPGRFEDNTPSRRATKSRRVALAKQGAWVRGWARRTACGRSAAGGYLGGVG